jgi:hypothetical protein
MEVCMDINHELRKHGPSLLAAAGIAGFFGAVFMVAKAAPVARDILDDMPEDASTMDKVRAVAPNYIPTVGVMLISTSCIMMSTRLLRSRYAGLLALYSVTEKAMERWQEAALKEVGPKKVDKIKDRVIDPNEDPKPIPPAILVDEGGVLFKDSWSGRYFKLDSVNTVRTVVNNLNDQILKGDWIALNHFYYELGLEPVQEGDEVGWVSYHSLIDVDYGSFIKDDRAVITITFNESPRRYEYD